jgi:hypothetical protein
MQRTPHLAAMGDGFWASMRIQKHPDPVLVTGSARRVLNPTVSHPRLRSVTYTRWPWASFTATATIKRSCHGTLLHPYLTVHGHSKHRCQIWRIAQVHRDARGKPPCQAERPPPVQRHIPVIIKITANKVLPPAIRTKHGVVLTMLPVQKSRKSCSIAVRG